MKTILPTEFSRTSVCHSNAAPNPQPVRRDVLAGLGALMSTSALAILPTSAKAAPEGAAAFNFDTVKLLAEGLAQAPFRKPKINLSGPLRDLTYDQYRDIRFREERAIWRGAGVGTTLQLFSVGFLYDAPVEVNVLENGVGRRVNPSPNLFRFGPSVPKVSQDTPIAFSGFRIHGPLKSRVYDDEYAVFQGASYFRLIGNEQIYGLSARGLSINTARTGGEEFPVFREFWIEKPKSRLEPITIYALLDSDSVTGAYMFTIASGKTAEMEVTARLYPRRDVPHVGIAPLTSMYLHGPGHNRVGNDFRPSVHDSEGLVIENGRGERIWRQLTNPQMLQVSAFGDVSPRGFGLAQRDRRFSNFEDLEARYEKRPTAWIEPKGDWGKGFVELVEIPTQEEIHDNIAVFWKPVDGLRKGQPFEISYRLSWGASAPVPRKPLHVVKKTRVGVGPREGTFRFVVDFSPREGQATTQLPRGDLTASVGEISNLTVQKNSETGGLRAAFVFDPKGEDLSELRLSLLAHTTPQSEVWLYRWTKA